MTQAKKASFSVPDLKTAPAKKRLTEQEIEYMRQKDREMVRGIFRFFEVPGGNMSFSFRKYKGDEVESYSMNDGEIYTVPRGVAHHLSNNCWYPESQHKMDEFGRIVAQVNKKKRRCSFEPLDFLDSETLSELTPSNLETVTFLNKDI
jgi:hypothetical protein